MAFTPEQQAIIESNSRLVRANAFAGTGKSTTLRGVAEARPNQRGLLIAFNKAIQLEAEGSFPRNVKARTSHALAFPRFGSRYTSNEKLQPDIKPFHIGSITSAYTRSLPENVVRIFDQRVIETIKAFLASESDEFGRKHIVLGDSPAEKKYISPHSLLQAAIKVHACMRDPASSIPATHDVYFKEFQLSRPSLPYDFILFDEAQDTNPSLQAIISDQKCRVIYVGDRHQSIYGFRGAHNAMQTLAADASFYLTGSFRFGSDVAEVANRILALKGESVELRGLGSHTEVVQGPFDNPKGSAFISRTNSTVFDKANRTVSAGIPCAFVGGLGSYKFEVGEDISKLKQFGPSEVKNPFIASFDSFESLAEYSEAVGDRELTGWAKVVDRYGARRFDGALARIRREAIQYDSNDESQHEAVVVVTAHRSKGLEFDRVELAENFIDTLDEESGLLRDFEGTDRETMEELNLLYVAATRARKHLAVNTSIAQLFDPELVPRQVQSQRAAAC